MLISLWAGLNTSAPMIRNIIPEMEFTSVRLRILVTGKHIPPRDIIPTGIDSL